jgi:MurNAc alpha-1-phosphate uridylyltransferase
MKAMILAAGRGERMRQLTAKTPKPLLRVGGKTLLEYHLETLGKAGIRDVVINVAYLGQKIIDFAGDGATWGLNIAYSHEGDDPLETAGGIIHALPLLGDGPFIIVNADIWTDYPFQSLPAIPGGLVHLVMVNNPEHHPTGDFVLQGNSLSADGEAKLTYSGIGVYRPELFKDYPQGKRPLLPILQGAMRTGQASGEHYKGGWMDIGTPERLQKLDVELKQQPFK